VFWAVGAYKRLVGMRLAYRTAFAQIDTHLKHRYGLIPTLVETVRSSLPHERETLQAVTTACNQAMDANDVAARDPADATAVRRMVDGEAALGASLETLSALAQANAGLLSNDTMRRLTEELATTEHRIAFARHAYNDSVVQYNRALKQFPGSVVARLFGLKTAEPLQSNQSPLERRGRPGA
jgi:LemA protein